MPLNILCTLCFIFGALTVADLVDYHYEFQVETRRHCIDGLKDAKGSPPPCSRSIAPETAGLTLPGMEDGILTTRSHVIIASDGSEVNIEAHPSYPYQYFINTMTADSVAVEHVLNAESHLIGQAVSRADTIPTTLSGSTSLEDDGWTFVRSTKRDGVMVNEWVKESFQGVDNATGANFSGIYMANLAPDTWTLYMDEHNEKPMNIVATNGRHGHVVHQEMKFSKFEKKSGQLSAVDAHKRMQEMYGIKNGFTGMLLEAYDDIQKDMNDDFSSWRTQVLSGYIPADSHQPPEAANWLPRRHLRSSKVIPYFTIEDGTAAAAYFNRLRYPRKLMTLFEFQFPSSCNNSTNKNEFCIFVNADGSGFQASFSLSAGIRLPDVHQPGRVAELALALKLSLSSDNKNLVLDLTVYAAGCAVVWELGEGISISITVCLKASGGVNYSNETLCFAASIAASISFDVNLPVIGSIIDFTISGAIGMTAAPNNTVTAFGKIGVSHSILIAGASIAFDITAATADHLPNKWEFSSGVTLSAWINLIFWRPHWGKRYLLWTIGPIKF